MADLYPLTKVVSNLGACWKASYPSTHALRAYGALLTDMKWKMVIAQATPNESWFFEYGIMAGSGRHTLDQTEVDMGDVGLEAVSDTGDDV